MMRIRRFNKINRLMQAGTTLGILGSGQIGRMLSMVAKRLGFTVCIYDRVSAGPAYSCADKHYISSFEDHAMLKEFLSAVDLITIEFENIPATVLEFLESHSIPVFPSSSILKICQNRVLEKNFLSQHGIPVVPYFPIYSLDDLKSAIARLSTPAILKTSTVGYDGKGQITICSDSNLDAIWKNFSSTEAILEKKIDFQSEASLIMVRNEKQEYSFFPLCENFHQEGILDITVFPSHFSSKIIKMAEEIGRTVANHLELMGILTIEFFVLSDGTLLVNELAPRPHNSGHHTLETTFTSQFEQHIRGITGLPFGSTQVRSKGIMLNLLGDLWDQGEPRWDILLQEEKLFLNLYGKQEAISRRKMGHFTLLDADINNLSHAKHLRNQLKNFIQIDSSSN